MNLFHLRYFVQLAYTQHYTQAAKQLCIAQPSLSHAISQLEKELGVPLFEKNGRNTTLTLFGRQFLDCAKSALDTLDEGVDSIRRAAAGEGTVRLGLLRTLGVQFIPELTARFLATHPDKEIHFTFHTGATQQLLDSLSGGRCDLVFCSKPAEPFGFSCVAVDRQDLVLIVPLDHPLADRDSVELAEALPYPQVYFSKGSGLRTIIDNLFSQIGAAPRIAYETEEDQVIAGLVSQGFGVAVVPYMELLKRLDVKILQITRPSWERNFYMTSLSNSYMPPAVRSFYDFVLAQRI